MHILISISIKKKGINKAHKKGTSIYLPIVEKKDCALLSFASEELENFLLR